MSKSPRDILKDRFEDLTDRRRTGSCKFTLYEILMTALCATVAGADSFPSISDFTESHLDRYREFLELQDGAPCAQTYRRVLAMIDPEELEIALMLIANDLNKNKALNHIALDGKTLRGSRSVTRDLKALHMVSAWLVESGIVLGQIKVDEKSNEITAVPQLLDCLALKGAVVSMDAMGTQKNIAQQIVDNGADYVLALKDNHPKTCQDVAELFEQCEDSELEAMSASRHETRDKGHGRLETRIYTTLPAESYYIEGAGDWSGLEAIGKVESRRTAKGETSVEVRYYLLSFGDVKRFAEVARGHWSIENHLHGCLDVTFLEDASKIVDRRLAENMSVLRRVALMLLKRDRSQKASLKRKRRLAGWNPRFLSKVLGVEPRK